MTAIEYVKEKIRKTRSLLLIKGNPRAQRVLIAWEDYDLVPCKALNQVPSPKLSPREVLKLLWEAAGDPDMRRLARLADVPESKVEKIFWRLKESALLWPDGTISSVAEKLLSAESMAYIEDLNSRQKRTR